MTARPPVNSPARAQTVPGRGPGRSDLQPRIVSALVLVAMAFATLWAGGQVFVLFWLLASLAVLWEWQRMISAPGYVSRLFAGASGLAICAALASNGFGDWAIAALALAALLTGALARINGGSARQCAWAAAGVFYAGLLLISVLVLRLSQSHGLEAILWLFAIVWGTDILAYCSGRTIGGPKLWPKVSPSKTWAGFAGGVLGGAMAGTILISVALLQVREHWPWMFVFALLFAIGSQAGDLLESAVKRRYNVKDSSNLIPGHGGALDRLDGFTAATVCAAMVGMIKAGPVDAAHGLLIW